MKTLDKRDRQVARPLKVLIPLIKQDLLDGDVAAKQAGMPYYIAAGEKLIEAKSQVGAMRWGDWLQKNFHLSQGTANQYMRVSRKSQPGRQFETLSKADGDYRKNHQSSWTEPVRDALNRLEVEDFNFKKRAGELEVERNAERELALKLIDIGYKVLATKLHPDKNGGTSDAMRRLNRVRARLKECA